MKATTGSYPRHIPAPPAPAQTRPTIKAFIEGATPYNALSAAKMANDPI